MIRAALEPNGAQASHTEYAFSSVARVELIASRREYSYFFMVSSRLGPLESFPQLTHKWRRTVLELPAFSGDVEAGVQQMDLLPCPRETDVE